MKLSQFRFDLPPELVATHPRDNRDDSRLMVVDRKTHTIEHHQFKDIINFLQKNNELV